MGSLEAKTYTVDDIMSLDAAMEQLIASSPYTLTVSPGGLVDPPAIEIIRAIRSGYDFDVELLDRLSRFCLMGKTVTILSDGKPLGMPFLVNSMDTPWDSYDVIRQYPSSLQFIFSICQDHIVKKSLPPRKSTPEVAAGASSSPSNSAQGTP